MQSSQPDDSQAQITIFVDVLRNLGYYGSTIKSGNMVGSNIMRIIR